MASPIVLTLNHAQRRISRDRIATLVSGFFEPDLVTGKPLAGWDPYWGTKDGNNDLLTWYSPLSGRLFLTPAPLLKAWETTGTGIYARLAKSDFTFNDSTQWEEQAKNGGASKFLCLKDSAAGSADRSCVTTSTWAKNRAFYIAWYASNWGDDKRTTVEFGWNSSASGSSGVSVRVKGGGSVEVWKDGRLVGEGSIVGKNQTAGKQTANNFVSLLVIPCPQRELEILSNQGGGMVHAFTDIDDSEEDPTITGATNFWLNFPDGLAEFECAPVQYPSSGYRAGIVSYATVAPPSGESPSFTRYFSGPGYGTVDVSASVVEHDDATSAFVPDGAEKRFRVRLDLSGDGSASPIVMGVMAEWPTVAEETDDSESLELAEVALEGFLEASEHPAGVRAGFTLKSPDDTDPDDATGLKGRSNSPFLLSIDGLTVLDGATEPTEYVLSPSDETDRLVVNVRDRWKQLEQYRFSDPMPLDGLTLKEATELVATCAGFDLTEIDVEDDAFTLPTAVGAGSHGDWNVLVEPGDTAAEWLERLRDSYAATWFLGIVPTATGPVLRFRSPEDLDDEPVATVYLTDEEAQTEGGYDADEAWMHVARSWTERRLEPEANDVWVSGFDPKTLRPIPVRYPDTESMDPTLAPSERPENWLGEPRKYGYQDPALTTLAACERAAELLFRRLTPVRKLAEFESEMLIKDDGLPVWRGDVVDVYGKGEHRVVSFSVRFVQEPNDGGVSQWRSARYTLEKIEEGTAQGTGGRLAGVGILEMQIAHVLAAHSKTVAVGRRMPALYLPLVGSELP